MTSPPSQPLPGEKLTSEKPELLGSGSKRASAPISKFEATITRNALRCSWGISKRCTAGMVAPHSICPSDSRRKRCSLTRRHQLCTASRGTSPDVELRAADPEAAGPALSQVSRAALHVNDPMARECCQGSDLTPLWKKKPIWEGNQGPRMDPSKRASKGTIGACTADLIILTMP